MIRLRFALASAVLGAVLAAGCDGEPASTAIPNAPAALSEPSSEWLALPPATGHATEVQVNLNRNGRLELRRILAGSRRAVALHPAEVGDGWTELRDEPTGTEVAFRLLDHPAGVARISGDVVDYAPVAGASAHVAMRLHSLGVEDFVRLAQPGPVPQLTYAVALRNVSQLRVSQDTIEFFDAEGHARFRTLRPSVQDARGERRWARLSVTSCVDAPLKADEVLPTVSKLKGGECQVTVTWDETDMVYPLLVDRPWDSTGQMKDGRCFHTATVVDDKVVVIGGYGQLGSPLASVEEYDPATETWDSNAWKPLPVGRAWHTATALSGGRILVVGGTSEAGDAGAALDTAIIGTKAEGWGNETSMKSARIEHVAVPLPVGSLDPDRVVIVGGGAAKAEIFDTTAPNAPWSEGTASKVARYGLAAVGMPGGFVLVTGGSENRFPNQGWLASVEQYDSQNDQWHDKKPMSVGRAGHSATLLEGEKVLVVGGGGGSEIFSNGSWLTTDDAPPTRQWHSTVLLPSEDGEQRVVIAGGALNWRAQSSAGYFAPESTKWQTLPTSLEPARYGHTMSVLSGGHLVVAGGRQGFGTAFKDTSVATLLGLGEACGSPNECFSGFCSDSVCCESACLGDCAACSTAEGSTKSGRCQAQKEGKTCHESDDACLADSVCDGNALDCPKPAPVKDGTRCDDGDAATEGDRCDKGVCVTTSAGGADQGGAGGDPSGGDGGDAGNGGEGAGGSTGGKAPPPLAPGTNPFSCQLGNASRSSSGAWFLLALTLLRRRRGQRRTP